MAASDIAIICFDPVADTNLNRAVVFTRAMRSNFTFSHGVPGGNLKASWRVSCDHIADVGFPKPKARILIMDMERGTYLWRGVLQTPSLSYERGKLVEVEFQAVGCAEGSWRQFGSPTVFGVTDVLATINGRQLCTSLGEIMQFGLTITPLIDGSQGFIDDGGVLTEDTRDYRGQVAPQLWEDVCNLTRGLSDPFIWLVQPDPATGLAALYFYAQPESVSYFEHGNAKSNRLEIDYSEIANQIYLAFQGAPLIQVPAVGDPLDYTNTPDIQTHFVDVSDDIREYNTAAGFAGSLYARFNQRAVTGGQIVLDRDIRSVVSGTPEMIPCYEVRAGLVIESEVTYIPYLNSSTVDVLIASAEYNEDACEMTISPSALNKLGKDARILALRGESAGTTWAWTSRNMSTPREPLQKIEPIVTTSFFDGFYVNGWGDPSHPSVAPSENRGITRDADGNVTGLNPSPLPMPVTQDPEENAEPPLVEHGLPLFTKARESFFGFGLTGRKIHPSNLPDDRLNIPAVFGTGDENGDLIDGERMHTDIQEMYVDTFTISVLHGVPTTVTVKVDVWNWDLEDIRIADAFELTLTAQPFGRFQYDNSDEDHQPVLLLHGDQLRWKVEDATDNVILNCCLSSWRNWKEFPVLVGPAWIPGVS